MKNQRNVVPVGCNAWQLGNILGPWFLRAKYLGFTHSGPIALIVGVMTLGIGVLIWIFMKVVPRSQFAGYEEKKHIHEKKDEEPGFFEGLKLLVTQPYLLGIALIITIYEVIITIIDFQFKAAAKLAHPSELEYGNYLADFAVMTGVVSALCVLFGINSIQRMLGTVASLVLMPLLMIVAVVMVWLNPTLLTVLFWVMVMGKAVNYALNQPTIKQLYIPNH